MSDEFFVCSIKPACALEIGHGDSRKEFFQIFFKLDKILIISFALNIQWHHLQVEHWIIRCKKFTLDYLMICNEYGKLWRWNLRSGQRFKTRNLILENLWVRMFIPMRIHMSIFVWILILNFLQRKPFCRSLMRLLFFHIRRTLLRLLELVHIENAETSNPYHCVPCGLFWRIVRLFR